MQLLRPGRTPMRLSPSLKRFALALCVAGHRGVGTCIVAGVCRA